MAVTESCAKIFFSKSSGLNYEAKTNSVTGSVFNLRMSRSVFLVKPEAFYYKWQ